MGLLKRGLPRGETIYPEFEEPSLGTSVLPIEGGFFWEVKKTGNLMTKITI